ncbi:MAG: hypothetical protein IAE91_10180 [Ignavibacteriaceae bacterium]|nr:hypothetical protein [Ignavibacteriaceae bacterium]
MILETLAGDYSDIFIYSENRFDLADNFRILRKNSGVKNPIKIHYNDVCRYINEFKLKSVVAYRLLTNLEHFDTNYVKFGIPVVISGVEEVIFFDPIFAIRELEDNGFLSQDPDLRFRVQQVGLKSVLIDDGTIEYQESYCFDLEANEVQYQNDRAFAEIIFAFDDIDFEKVLDTATNSLQDSPPPLAPPPKATAKEKFKTLTSADISFQRTPAKPASDENRDSAKTFITLPFERKTTGMFEEDSNYDPDRFTPIVLSRPGSKTTERLRPPSNQNTVSDSQQQAKSRFEVVGTKRSEQQKTQITSRDEKAKSGFASFLEKKRSEVTSIKADEKEPSEITDSVSEFMKGRENRFIVLKIRK